jgi:hypothetical protein
MNCDRCKTSDNGKKFTVNYKVITHRGTRTVVLCDYCAGTVLMDLLISPVVFDGVHSRLVQYYNKDK